jgi:hypothetical protein
MARSEQRRRGQKTYPWGQKGQTKTQQRGTKSERDTPSTPVEHIEHVPNRLRDPGGVTSQEDDRFSEPELEQGEHANEGIKNSQRVQGGGARREVKEWQREQGTKFSSTEEGTIRGS